MMRYRPWYPQSRAAGLEGYNADIDAHGGDAGLHRTAGLGRSGRLAGLLASNWAGSGQGFAVDRAG